MGTEHCIDTLKVAERLQSVGTPVEQAKMHATVLAEVVEAECARQVAVFARDVLDSALAPVHEGIVDLGKRIDRLDTETKAGFAETKAGFAETKAGFAETEAKFAEMSSKINEKFSEAKLQALLWVTTIGLLQTGLVVALVLKLAN